MAAWLVTGATGYLGRHVLAELRAVADPGSRIVTCGRRRPPASSEETFIEADLETPTSMARVVHEVEPDFVIHAAGATPPGDAERYGRVNAQGTANLLSAVATRKTPVRVVLVGSAAELGHVDPACLPVAEDHPCQPADAYARSKWEATQVGLAAERPVEVVVGRVFNPIGSDMPESLAFGRFARQLAMPGPEPLRLAVGNLDARRDFIDVRDVARALLALARDGHPGLIYHIGTGQSRRVGEGLDSLIQRSGRRVVLEKSCSASHGPLDSRADIRRIMSHTAWRPEVSWEQSLDDLWEAVQTRHRSASEVTPRSIT